MHTVFALLCFVVVINWLIFPYPSGLLHWHCGNLTIAPVPAKQPWWIWINTSCEFIMHDCITTTKQSTTKPCTYFMGYTVVACCLSSPTYYLNASWFVINFVLSCSTQGTSDHDIGDQICETYKIPPSNSATSPRSHSLNTFRWWHFQMHFFKEFIWILLTISLKFVPKFRITNIPAVIQMMAWCWPGGIPLLEPIMVNLLIDTQTKALGLDCHLYTWLYQIL